MRTVRATRYNHPNEHASYGIYNWFKLKGIKNVEVVKEAMYNFCLENNFEGLSAQTREHKIMMFCHNRFQKFAQYATKFLTENNYA